MVVLYRLLCTQGRAQHPLAKLNRNGFALGWPCPALSAITLLFQVPVCTAALFRCTALLKVLICDTCMLVYIRCKKLQRER